MQAMNGHKLQARAGTTLLELIIAAAIFGVLITAVFAIFNLGARHWRVIESRNAGQNEIRKIQSDLEVELERSTWQTFQGSSLTGILVRMPADDYRFAICMQTAIDPNSRAFDIDPLSNQPVSHGFVLYYIIRPPGDTCLPNPPSSPDNTCPHKWLVRKDLDKSANISNNDDLAPYLDTDLTPGGNVRATRLLAQNVLTFEMGVNYPLSKVIEFHIRTVKEAPYKAAQGNGENFTLDPSRIMQVDNRVIPRN